MEKKCIQHTVRGGSVDKVILTVTKSRQMVIRDVSVGETQLTSAVSSFQTHVKTHFDVVALNQHLVVALIVL